MNDEYWNIDASTEATDAEVREAYGENANPIDAGMWNMAWELDSTPDVWKAAWTIAEAGGIVEFRDEFGIHWTVETY
jgi:hypothetical protein